MKCWNSFQHTGPKFPTNYQYRKIPLVVNGVKCNINEICEEFIFFYILLYPKYKHDSVFITNFWNSLYNHLPVDIQRIIKTTTKDIHSHFNFTYFKNFKPRNFSKTVSHVVIDNKKYEICNNHIESPHIFIGRGSHPLRGTCKFSLKFSDITLNLSKQYHHFFPKFNVVENKKCFWTCTWKDKLTHENKYIYPKLSESTKIKFDKALQLSKKLNKINNQLHIYLNSKNNKFVQCALSTILIKKFLIRIGNEKNEEFEVNTIGCCSLTKKCIDINNNHVTLKFIGKDSIPFCKKMCFNEFIVTKLRTLINAKSPDDILFDLINPCILNRFLNKLMDSLTAKTFRTCMASTLFYKILFDNSIQMNPKKKVLFAYKKCAEICNHKCKKNDEFINNPQTSKLNYIDPRILFKFCLVNKLKPYEFAPWLENFRWANNIPKTFAY